MSSGLLVSIVLSDGRVKRLTMTSIVTDKVIAGSTASRPANAVGRLSFTNPISFQARVTIAPQHIEAMAPCFVARFQSSAAIKDGVMEAP